MPKKQQQCQDFEINSKKLNCEIIINDQWPQYIGSIETYAQLKPINYNVNVQIGDKFKVQQTILDTDRGKRRKIYFLEEHLETNLELINKSDKTVNIFKLSHDKDIIWTVLLYKKYIEIEVESMQTMLMYQHQQGGFRGYYKRMSKFVCYGCDICLLKVRINVYLTKEILQNVLEAKLKMFGMIEEKKIKKKKSEIRQQQVIMPIKNIEKQQSSQINSDEDDLSIASRDNLDNEQIEKEDDNIIDQANEQNENNRNNDQLMQYQLYSSIQQLKFSNNNVLKQINEDTWDLELEKLSKSSLIMLFQILKIKVSINSLIRPLNNEKYFENFIKKKVKTKFHNIYWHFELDHQEQIQQKKDRKMNHIILDQCYNKYYNFSQPILQLKQQEQNQPETIKVQQEIQLIKVDINQNKKEQQKKKLEDIKNEIQQLVENVDIDQVKLNLLFKQFDDLNQQINGNEIEFTQIKEQQNLSSSELLKSNPFISEIQEEEKQSVIEQNSQIKSKSKLKLKQIDIDSVNDNLEFISQQQSLNIENVDEYEQDNNSSQIYQQQKEKINKNSKIDSLFFNDSNSLASCDPWNSEIQNQFNQQNQQQNQQIFSYTSFSSQLQMQQLQRNNIHYHNNNNMLQQPQNNNDTPVFSEIINFNNNSLNSKEGNSYRLYPTPSNMKSQLKNYQMQALGWMLYREERIKYQDLLREVQYDERLLNPLWEELELLDGKLIYFNQLTGRVSELFQKALFTHGGILADEMGLGKTVIGLALIHQCKELELQKQNDLILIDSDKISPTLKNNKEKQNQNQKSNMKKAKIISKRKKLQSEIIDIEDDNWNASNNNNEPELEVQQEKNVIDIEKEDDDDVFDIDKYYYQNNQKKQKKQIIINNNETKNDDLVISLKKTDFMLQSEQQEQEKNKNDEQINKGISKKKSLKINLKQLENEKKNNNQLNSNSNIKENENENDQIENKDEKQDIIQDKKQDEKQDIKQDKKQDIKQDEQQNEKIKANTLIVVPKTIINQWISEINKHSYENTLTYYKFHEKIKEKLNVNLEKYDIVFTTYDVLGVQYKNLELHRQEIAEKINQEQKEQKQKNNDQDEEFLIDVKKKKQKKVKKITAEQYKIFSYHWNRIILDEGHYIKNRYSNKAKGAFELSSQNRWVFTGTPIQNSYDDLFSLLHFLRVDTFGDYFYWNSYINKSKNQEEAIYLIKQVISNILLRRTKNSTYEDGQKILMLPKKHEEIINVHLNKIEMQIYAMLAMNSEKFFNQLLQKGEVNQQYAHIFKIIMYLRMLCDSPLLLFNDLSKIELEDVNNLEKRIQTFIDNKKQQQLQIEQQQQQNVNNEIVFEVNQNQQNQNQEIEEEKIQNQEENNNNNNNQKQKGLISDAYKLQVIQKIKNGEFQICEICYEEILEHCLSKCLHVFCKKCFHHVVNSPHPTCPNCRRILKEEDLMDINLDLLQSQQQQDNQNLQNQQRSSKIIAVLEKIKQIKANGEKCVIYTQWLKMMAMIQQQMDENNIKFEKLDGSLSAQQREQAIENFSNKIDVTVFIVSLRAGSVGLNLIAANHVLIVDPWWNPALEDQATERIHRIGQTKEVYITRFICNKSIEERIIQLHEKKKNMIDQCLITMNKEDKKKQNIEEFKFLLKN